VHPRAKVFDLLVELIERRDQSVTREDLIERLWPGTNIGENSLAQCVNDLRKALGDDARNPRFIQTVPKVGYRFIAPVEEVLAEAEIKGSRTARWTWALAAILLAVLVLALAWKWFPRGETPVKASRREVAVLFFDNQSQTAELDWLREGLADMFGSSLGRSTKLDVLSRQQVFSLLEHSGYGAKPLRLDDALNVARRSRAELLLMGSFAKLGGKIRVGVELHDVPANKLLATQSFTADRPEDILTGVDLVSLKLMTSMRVPPGAGKASTGLAAIMTSNLGAYRNYSLALEKANAYHSKEALELLEKAVALDPGFAMAHARMGYIYGVTWNHASLAKPYLEKAFRLSDRLTEKDRLDISAWYAIANLDWPEAVRRYREIVAAYPAEIEGHLRLAHLLRGEEQFDEAAATLKQALVIDPDEPDAHNVLGGLYSFLGRHQEAIAMESRYVALRPGEPNAYDSLALVYQWAGQLAEARGALRQALEINPRFEPAVVHLANLDFRMGRYREAVKGYERYIGIASSDFERARGCGSIAHLHECKGDFARAEKAARMEARYNPAASANLAILLLRRGDQASADDLLRKMPQTEYTDRGARPPRRWDHCFRGRRALLLQQPAEAIAEFQEALRHPAGFADMDFVEDCLASAYLQLGRLDDAIAEYQRVLRMYPQDALAQAHLAMAWQRKGRLDLARPAFQRFLEIWKDADPDIPEVLAAQ